MKKKALRKNLTIAGIIVAALVFIALIVVIILGKKKLDTTKTELDNKIQELNENQRLVYVASKEITKGEKIELNVNVMEQNIYSGLPESSYMTETQLGQTAIVDIKPYEPVMANMITEVEVTKDLRWYEVAVANLMTTQKNYDVVDIRIMFPNGEDYTVLPKKTVTDLLIDTNIFTIQANEDEIMRMASAIIDAYTTTGARIYTTKYIESNIQEEPIPNYPVKPEVLDLINNDPNILNQAIETLNLRARNDLDRRLSNLKEEQLEAVANGWGLQDTASGSVIRDDDGNLVFESDGTETETTEDGFYDETTTTDGSTETTAEGNTNG
jgi:hypothetical protein